MASTALNAGDRAENKTNEELSRGEKKYNGQIERKNVQWQESIKQRINIEPGNRIIWWLLPRK